MLRQIAVIVFLFAVCGPANLFASGVQRAKPAVVLDVMRVRATGSPKEAVVHIPAGPVHDHACDVAIIGAGMGGVSAALEAQRAGISVCLTEHTLWVGGQMTSQGVSEFDGNRWVETTGVTESFQNLRKKIREHYYEQLKSTDGLSSGGDLPALNPGRCWVSHLCFEPQVGLSALESTMRPYIADGHLHLWLHTVPVRVARSGNQITSVLVYSFKLHQWLRLRAKYFVDATPTGSLIALSGIPFRIGAESRAETGEPDAPSEPDPHAVQSINYSFLLSPGSPASSSGQLSQPPQYAKFEPKYSFTINYGHGKIRTFRMFAKAPGTPGSFWNYRRVVDSTQFREGAYPGDISLINWNSNDFCDENLFSANPGLQAEGLQEAKRVSLGFAWWLLHDAPHDEGTGRGYPNLHFQQAGMGSPDGLSQQAYIRESRRIIPLRTIVEQDVAAKFLPGARAALYADTVGIGSYAIDIHGCGGNSPAMAAKPYEIPLGSLIDRNVDNLLAASLDIGTTHITNGAYRLHPTLWSIGEAVGATISDSIKDHVTPREIDRSVKLTRKLQLQLLKQGHPIFWFDDVLPNSSLFSAAQVSTTWGWLPFDSQHLHFDPNRPLSGSEVAHALRTSGLATNANSTIVKHIAATQHPTWKDLKGIGFDDATATGAITKGKFAMWLLQAYVGKTA